MSTDLKNLQTLLYRTITAAPGTAAGSGLAVLSQAIRGDERLPVLQRVKIYADAYFYRLLDCLKEDFPATATVAGDPVFEDTIRAYLAKNPPTEPSIIYAGRYLADFLANNHLRERWPFVAELARFERTIIEVFHDPDAPALTASNMRSLAPADWPGFSLRTHPALRILDCEWRVNDVLRAVENGTELKAPERGPVTLLIWRQATQVYYRELEAPERAALEIASGGADLAAVCEALAAHLPDEDPAAAVNQTLVRWFADGLLAGD